MSKHTIIGAVEIGTAKTLVLLAEVVKGNTLSIIGMGQVRSEGIKKGEIQDFKAASECTHQALRQAEKSANARIECVYLSQTGGHLRGYLNPGVVNVSSSNNLVSRLDINRVQENAKNKQLSEDHVYIHHMRNPYKLDGRIIKDPYMMEGERLEVSYWSVHGDAKKIRDSIHIINGFGLKVEDVITSSVASGSIVATQTEKNNGVLVLDIGCGTTDYILYKEGYVIRTGAIPIGGDHITNDLSLGLRIQLEQSEQIKQEYAKAIIDPKDKEEYIQLNEHKGTQDRKIIKESIYKITHARIQELFHLIYKQLEPWMSYNQLPAGVIITGGTSRLNQIEILIKQEMGLDARLAQNPSWASNALKNPEYSTALGLLNYALNDRQNNIIDTHNDTGILSKMAKLFT